VIALFPQASATFHVLVIVPPQAPGLKVVSEPVTLPPASQLSVQAKSIISGTSSIHSTVISAGAASRTGAVVSITVINCSQLFTFPLLSVEAHVLVIK
jgi:hypothetical protein